MGDVRRWSVTYTKHVKQKRKVYQDGFLELQSSGNKVALYDDCEKLLDCRFLKLDDAVRSGETLMLGSYLVDIGNPDGDHKHFPGLSFEGRDRNHADDMASLSGSKLKFKSASVGHRKYSLGMNIASSSNRSPSQELIREFKKSNAPHNGFDSTKSNTTEWQVLFTTQLTQKTKKFHDGTLRLVICGLQGRQVMLYDIARRLLDSRFLKKDEMIKSGESLTFDGHLVEIGELEGDHKPLTESNIQRRDFNEARVLHGERTQKHITNPIEWEVMYTAQITQKMKKYHCGTIRLASCGSYRMQATLLTEDGTILSSRYLKLSEEIMGGSVFQMPRYLVEVGELQKHPPGECRNYSLMVEGTEPRSKTGPSKIMSSCRVPENKPLRDAKAILSILKKPTSKGIITTERASFEKFHDSQPSDVSDSDIQNQLQGKPVQGSCSGKTVVEVDGEETATKHYFGAFPYGLEESNISMSTCNSESRLNSNKKEDSPSAEPLVSDESIVAKNWISEEAERGKSPRARSLVVTC